MAYVGPFTCQHCGQEKVEVVTSSRICASCRAAIAKADEVAHISKLEALPISERLRRVELQLYRMNAAARLDAIEARFATY